MNFWLKRPGVHYLLQNGSSKHFIQMEGEDKGEKGDGSNKC